MPVVPVQHAPKIYEHFDKGHEKDAEACRLAARPHSNRFSVFPPPSSLRLCTLTSVPGGFGLALCRTALTELSLIYACAARGYASH